MNRFNVGDKVVCTDEFMTGVFTVQEVAFNERVGHTMILTQGDTQSWASCSRFVLAEQEG